MLIILKFILISLLCFNSISSQKVEFPSMFKLIRQSPLWIDFKDLNKIKIGMNKNDILENIGMPVQFYEFRDEESETHIYRVREFGYVFIRYLKPDLIKHLLWSDDSYYLYFKYDNEKLKEIKSEFEYATKGSKPTKIKNYQYYDPKKSLEIKTSVKDMAKSLANKLQSLSPKWIDLSDLSKIKIGMNEKEINEGIGVPNLLLSSKSNIKKVIYRVREIYTATSLGKKIKLKLPTIESNYIKEKGGEPVYINPSSIFVGTDKINVKTINGESLIIKKKKIESLVINDKKQDLKNLKTKPSAGVWSGFSYNLLFTYNNDVLTSINRYDSSE